MEHELEQVVEAHRAVCFARGEEGRANAEETAEPLEVNRT